MTQMAPEVADSPHRSIFELFGEAKRAVGPVGKDSTNEQQKFKFRGIDAVVNAIAPHFDAAGIIPAPALLEESHEYLESARGGRIVVTRVKVRYTFYGPRGDSFEGAVVPGESMDSGDKSTAKAMSVAYRTALLQCLNLPTSDPDPDATAYDMAEPVEDDGNWGEWSQGRIDGLKTREECLALDTSVRTAYTDGRLAGQMAKAKNICSAIAERANVIKAAADANDAEPDASAPDDERLPLDVQRAAERRREDQDQDDEGPVSSDPPAQLRPESPADPAPDPAAEWKAKFKAGVAAAADSDALRNLRRSVGQAVMDKIISPEESQQATQMITERLQTVRSAA